MPLRVPRLACLPLLLLLAFTALSCSGQRAPLAPSVASDDAPSAALAVPVAEPEAPETGFFPLHLDNRWAYNGRIVESLVPDDGPASRSERTYRLRSALVCREEIGGRPYIVSREHLLFNGGEEFTQWIRYRQDGTGLYEADGPIGNPPSCEGPRRPAAATERTGLAAEAAQRSFDDPATQAAWERARADVMERFELARRLIAGGAPADARDGGVAPEGLITELRRLAYPLRLDARWVIRADPRFVSHVVAHESLQLPVGREAGWKVRIRSELFGPDDRVAFWVSRKGFLKYAFHIVGVVTGPTGDRLGTITMNERRELVAYHLAGRGRSATAGPEPVSVAVEPRAR